MFYPINLYGQRQHDLHYPKFYVSNQLRRTYTFGWITLFKILTCSYLLYGVLLICVDNADIACTSDLMSSIAYYRTGPTRGRKVNGCVVLVLTGGRFVYPVRWLAKRHMIAGCVLTRPRVNTPRTNNGTYAVPPIGLIRHYQDKKSIKRRGLRLISSVCRIRIVNHICL